MELIGYARRAAMDDEERSSLEVEPPVDESSLISYGSDETLPLPGADLDNPWAAAILADEVTA